MANFYIKSITATGNNRIESIIDFTDGLNIIYEVSDTGKTCVIKCINFIFGSSALPFDESTGYSKVKMILVAKGGNVSIERELGKNKMYVFSDNEDIDSGTYHAKKGKLSISSVFLRLIGIEGEHQIVKNKDFSTRSLTWRTFVHMFLIKETEVFQEESILLPKVPQDRTAFFFNSESRFNP